MLAGLECRRHVLAVRLVTDDVKDGDCRVKLLLCTDITDKSREEDQSFLLSNKAFTQGL